MKKFTLLFCFGVVTAFAFSTNLKAQEITSELHEYKSVPDPEDEDYEWDIANGILRVSDNGKYAVCSTPNNYPYTAMFVDIDNNEVTYLNPITGESKDKLIVMDVADDGLIGGGYIAQLTSSTGSDSLVWHPGVKYLDGDWIDLPLPEKAIKDYLSYETTTPDDYTHFVKRVSSDGKVLLGQVWYEDWVEVAVDSLQYKVFYEPMLWYFDPETKTCTGMKEFTELPYTGQGFIPYDMTDDGSVIVGMCETVKGDQCPAYIKDGEIVFLETPSDDGVYWAGGMAECIDDAGNIYYKYPDDSTNSLIHSGKYNVYTGERTYYPDSLGHVICGIPGLVLGMTLTMYGPCAVFEGDTSLPVSDLTYPENISDDGKVIAGANLNESYSPYDYPALLVFSESPVQSGIRTIRLDGISLNKSGNIITISGEYDKAEIVNAAGQVCGYTTGSIDMSGLANGLYMIKVSKGNQTNVYKIMK